jgi:hypothetical protein
LLKGFIKIARILQATVGEGKRNSREMERWRERERNIVT